MADYRFENTTYSILNLLHIARGYITMGIFIISIPLLDNLFLYGC